MKHLMTTAATMIALSTAAHAQDSGPFTSYQVQPEQDLLVSDLIGSRIYATEQEVSGPVESNATAEWDDLGEINGIVLSQDGSVEVVVLGIGGFLGIGEQNTAIPFEELQIVRNVSDVTGYFLVVNATQDEIENAPEFVRDLELVEPGETEQPSEPGAENLQQNMEQTGANMAQPGEDIGNTVGNATENIVQEAGDAARDAGQAVEDAGQAARDAAREVIGNN